MALGLKGHQGESPLSLGLTSPETSIASERVHISALWLELILPDRTKPVAYGGEAPHFVFALVLTLAYASELKWGPKCQYPVKELNT